MMFVSNSLRSTAGSLEGILCVHVDDKICGGSGPSFSKALLNFVFHFVSVCRTKRQKRS